MASQKTGLPKPSAPRAFASDERFDGVTLLELVIVLAFLSVLVLLATNSYQAQLVNARRATGVAELYTLMAQQEHFRARYGRYALHLQELGYASGTYAINARGTRVNVDDARRIYTFSLSTTPGSFTIAATPQTVQRRDVTCGQLRLNSLGIRLNDGPGSIERCW